MDRYYNSVLLLQEVCAMVLMITSTVLLFKQLNKLAARGSSFRSEKKVVLLTAIFFNISFFSRIIMASCQIASFYAIDDFGEVAAV